MPMKCIDQMPVPMENAPPSSQSFAARPFEAVMRLVRSRAVYEASVATSTERTTSQ